MDIDSKLSVIQEMRREQIRRERESYYPEYRRMPERLRVENEKEGHWFLSFRLRLFAGCDTGILVEHFIKITQPEEQNTVLILFLDGVILPLHGGQFFIVGGHEKPLLIYTSNFR